MRQGNDIGSAMIQVCKLDWREVRERSGKQVKEDATAQERPTEKPNPSHSRATAEEGRTSVPTGKV